MIIDNLKQIVDINSFSLYIYVDKGGGGHFKRELFSLKTTTNLDHTIVHRWLRLRLVLFNFNIDHLYIVA